MVFTTIARSEFSINSASLAAAQLQAHVAGVQSTNNKNMTAALPEAESATGVT